MPARTRSEYHKLRRKYEPTDIRLIIIAESPPVSGKYFYDPVGKTSESLFAAMMKQLHFTPRSKEEGLEEFKRAGWLLVDATYQAVNTPDADRDRVIEQDYPLLSKDLSLLTRHRSTPLILIKANVCRLLEPRLIKDGFDVCNNGNVVYFPSNGQQEKFREQFGAILKAAGMARLDD